MPALVIPSLLLMTGVGVGVSGSRRHEGTLLGTSGKVSLLWRKGRQAPEVLFSASDRVMQRDAGGTPAFVDCERANRSNQHGEAPPTQDPMLTRRARTASATAPFSSSRIRICSLSCLSSCQVAIWGWTKGGTA